MRQTNLHETKRECDRCGHEGFDVFGVGTFTEPLDLCRSCIAAENTEK